MFEEKTKGPIKEIDLQSMLYMICGGHGMMSKRLSPAMTIHNARIYADGILVHTCDLRLSKVYRQLGRLAETFEVTLTAFSETGKDTLWSSETPGMYLGWCQVDGKTCEHGAPIEDTLPTFEMWAKQTRRQWRIDHGIQRRNPREYLHDIWYWQIKSRIRTIGWKIKGFFKEKK
jgi:hypothetical protein